MGGKIEISETLFGTPPGKILEFRDVCRFSSHCRLWIWPIPKYPAFVERRGLWCLKKGSDGMSGPAAFSGYVDISKRAEYEDYIRRFKH